MQLPYFYTSNNVARVNVAMEISTQKLKFQKKKGKYHADVNVLGIAYTREHAVAARFSDTVNLEFDGKKQMEEAQKKPLHYENQFDVASGNYDLTVVFSASGSDFGKVEQPLVVEPYKTDEFSISGLALSKEAHPASSLGLGLDASLLEDKTPLMFKGIEVVPSGDHTFKKPDLKIFYFEVYEPKLVMPDPKTPTAVAIQMRILDRKTGQQEKDTGLLRLDLPKDPGNPVIPVGEKLPVDNLGPGSYVLELSAVDTAGENVKRSIDFDLE
jgi:hypothetical protein